MNIKDMENINGMPRSIKITVFYDSTLQKITGTESDPVFMSEWSTFVYLLKNVFISYPEIEKKYPPGQLGFIINGKPPTNPTTPLFDGDKVEFIVSPTFSRM